MIKEIGDFKFSVCEWKKQGWEGEPMEEEIMNAAGCYSSDVTS